MKTSSAAAILLGAVLTISDAAFLGEKRDRFGLEPRIFGSEIADSLKRVTTGVQKVDHAVLQVDSADINKFLAVLTASNDLAATIATETTYVAKQEVVDPLAGSINIQVATFGVIFAVGNLTTNIINIKTFADQAGVSPVVKQQLESQKVASDNYTDTVISKVPELYELIGAGNKAIVDGDLDKAIAAYS